MRRHKHSLSRALMFAGLFLAVGAPVAHAQELSATRQLRRIHLALTMQEPDVERYEALIAASDKPAFIQAELDALLGSEAFHEQLIDWGHEYIPIPEYPASTVWRESKSIHAEFCGAGTLHEGAFGIFGHQGDDESICNDPTATTAYATPWWDPMLNVTLIGAAANAEPEHMGKDCGEALVGLNWVKPVQTGCGCGPYMTYCRRFFLGDRFEGGYSGVTRLDGGNFHPNSQRRALHDEPARFLAHIVTQDRPFSDLILAKYTVVNRGLYHMYARLGRQSGLHPERDQDDWFLDFSSQEDWRQVNFHDMHPHLLDDEDYTFDPTKEQGQPQGVPASGVMTMLGPNAAWPRPRVRAARWLEALACDEFSPPELPIAFPPYQRDPAKEGVCLHCHTRLDPAAIHFKRIYDGGGAIGGVGNWRIEQLVSYDGNRKRFENTFLADTVMTPITQEAIDQNPNARFYDFLPPDQTLWGQRGDGTIGPRGLAKLMITSGAFDRCAVRRAYARFGGRTLRVGEDAALIQAQVEAFVASGRDMKALIRAILTDERAQKGD